jgi:hypothetical protein
MAEWMTGAMITDHFTTSFLISVMAAINSDPGAAGVAIVSIPTEISASAQIEKKTSDTGANVYWFKDVWGGGDIYPI